jgi:hypothetical protein
MGALFKLLKNRFYFEKFRDFFLEILKKSKATFQLFTIPSVSFYMSL